MRFIIVANRGPVRKTKDGWAPAVGGLSTALLPVLERHTGVWVSMPEEEDMPERCQYPEDNPRFLLRSIPLSEEEMANYYFGMANKVLWPVAHYMIQHLDLRRCFYDTYCQVNKRFASAVVEEYQEGDVVWVHDYHLMLAPQLIRRKHPSVPIGFFWHIPWPATEVFRILPWSRDLLRGLLASDLIGFHVEEYVENFLHAVRMLLGAKVEGNLVHWEGRRVRVEAHPIGIDVKLFQEMSDSEEVKHEVEALRKEVGAEYLVVGVDRLDYTKGIFARLLAFEQLLKECPWYHRRITLYQVATPSRTEVASYQQLKREIDEVVGRINGAFGQDTWVPVRYRYRSYAQQELVVLYRAADAALVTPLRDGMNLVSHEFIAANHHGTLILSELTGAAYLMPEALHVNPYDQYGLTQAIRTALEMPVDEKRERMTRLKQTVAGLDVHRWSDRFLASLIEQA